MTEFLDLLQASLRPVQQEEEEEERQADEEGKYVPI